MKLAALLFVAVELTAQTRTIAPTGPVTVRPGGSINLRVAYASTVTADVSGLQWSLNVPVGVTSSAVAGPAATAAAKTISCRTDGTICLAVGLNKNLIGNGDIAVYTLTFPASFPAGNVSLALSQILAADVNGAGLTIAGGPPLIVAVQSKYDLNGDGVVTGADVSLAIDQALGVTACGSADVTGDSKCDLYDVILIALAAIGN